MPRDSVAAQAPPTCQPLGISSICLLICLPCHTHVSKAMRFPRFCETLWSAVSNQEVSGVKSFAETPRSSSEAEPSTCGISHYLQIIVDRTQLQDTQLMSTRGKSGISREKFLHVLATSDNGFRKTTVKCVWFCSAFLL